MIFCERQSEIITVYNVFFYGNESLITSDIVRVVYIEKRKFSTDPYDSYAIRSHSLFSWIKIQVLINTPTLLKIYGLFCGNIVEKKRRELGEMDEVRMRNATGSGS
ncbi:hypothetical protein CRE_02267 [Caenorhabditis remanei]|uniref:Uncharacterized protein n=1 Tax=Caenorhabditis remanei TaxID=31234 RepID=E3LFZ2_CAERE|nr:hypothetical protein CRE_02267 [Caenorhabditis remanei]